MLQVTDLTIILREDQRTLIDHLSFTITENDKVALIGEEGNGKSMLLKAIARPESIKDICDLHGMIDTRTQIIGFLPQTADDEILKQSTEFYLTETLSAHNIPFDYTSYYTLLSSFNFPEERICPDISIHQLSGGERIKFLLLVEMMKGPTLLLLDEPSNDLDIESVRWLEHFMHQTDCPLLFVSHDTELLVNVANRIIHLERIYERTEPRHTFVKASYEDYVAQRSNRIATQTKRSFKERAEFDKKVDRYTRVHDAVESALRGTRNDHAGKNLKDKMQSVKALGKRLEKEEANLTKRPYTELPIDLLFDPNISVPNGKVILDLNLDELIVGSTHLASNIKLQIIGPERIAIVGRNGAGKTTLIRVIMNALERLNLKVGYMPQNYFGETTDKQSTLEYLMDGQHPNMQTQVSTYLGSLNFTRDEMLRDIKRLSGGQKAKVYFAKMNLERAEVLVLDEPTRNISPTSQPELIHALSQYHGVIIAVSHDQTFINQLCDKVYELTPNGLILKE